jgi:SAM-dependent methyltransferase
LALNTAQHTDQTRRWDSDFGREYTDRNEQTPEQLDQFYRQTYGVTRRDLNQRFLDGVPKDASFLEVGCNVGTQLLLLKEMGYSNLSGVEIQSYALNRAKERLEKPILGKDQPCPSHFQTGILISFLPRASSFTSRRPKSQWPWLKYIAALSGGSGAWNTTHRK